MTRPLSVQPPWLGPLQGLVRERHAPQQLGPLVVQPTHAREAQWTVVVAEHKLKRQRQWTNSPWKSILVYSRHVPDQATNQSLAGTRRRPRLSPAVGWVTLLSNWCCHGVLGTPALPMCWSMSQAYNSQPLYPELRNHRPATPSTNL